MSDRTSYKGVFISDTVISISRRVALQAGVSSKKKKKKKKKKTTDELFWSLLDKAGRN
jgi:hypothetical protein